MFAAAALLISYRINPDRGRSDGAHAGQLSSDKEGWPAALARQPHPTLVIYVFAASDPEYEGNLRFFVEEAVKVRGRGSISRAAARAAPTPSAAPFSPARRTLLPLQAGDGCDYLIVLQQGEGMADPDPLPELPPNARYVRHPNECFDLGTVGWALRTQVDTR
jgi:hypothetical protein